MKIDVYSDMVCPWCRIGKKNMYDALQAWNQETNTITPVYYHAYQLDPTLPPEGLPFNDAMEKKMGGAERLRPMLERVTQAGAEVGVTFRFDHVPRMPNTLLAHRITALLPQERQQEWVDAVMEAYFEEGKDIGSQQVLLDIAEELQLDSQQLNSRLDAGEGTDAVRKDIEAAQAIGITGVPFFIVNDKYALSGAYPAAQFLEAFRKIAQEG